MSKTPKSLLNMKKQILEQASPRRTAAINAIFEVCSSMLDEGLHISVVSVGDRTSKIDGGPTARTIYNTSDPYGNLVQAFVDVQSSQKPGEILGNSNEFSLPSLETIINNISDPRQKAVLRDFEHAASKVRDRMRILEGFVAKITAQQFSQMTNPVSKEHVLQPVDEQNRGNIHIPLGAEEQTILQDFLRNILFDEGYEIHDGDIFHTTSGRSLRAEKFVKVMEKITSPKIPGNRT